MKNILLAVLLIFFVHNLSAQPQKVIFDCDLGGDIDDAFALAFLLSNQDEFEIMGIVMDHGDTPGRAKIACKILYECGLDPIPVYVGRHTPGVVGKDTLPAGPSRQFLWAENFDKLKPESKPAAEFIVESLNKFPNEIILFTVGPVPNISDVLKMDPEALKKAKKVVSMFGSFYTGYGGGAISAEWNVRGDIASSRKLMGSGADLQFAGLDVTDHVILSDENLQMLMMRQSPLTNSLTALYSLWYKHADWAVTPKMFDAVAIGMVLWPELFETKEVCIKVNSEGYTLIDENNSPNCTIGVSIDKDVFLERMMKSLLEQNFERK